MHAEHLTRGLAMRDLQAFALGVALLGYDCVYPLLSRLFYLSGAMFGKCLPCDLCLDLVYGPPQEKHSASVSSCMRLKD